MRNTLKKKLTRITLKKKLPRITLKKKLTRISLRKKLTRKILKTMLTRNLMKTIAKINIQRTISSHLLKIYPSHHRIIKESLHKTSLRHRNRATNNKTQSYQAIVKPRKFLPLTRL